MRLNIVVFPAPFGPTRPVIEPLSICKSTPSTALIPPKCFDKFLTVIIISLLRSGHPSMNGFLKSAKLSLNY